MNKIEKKIFRGMIEKKLSDQDNFSDSDGDDPQRYDTIIKTEVSNYKDTSINTNAPYFVKHQSLESQPHVSINDFYYESKNDTTSYSKIREMINNEYSSNPGTSIYNYSENSKFQRNKVKKLSSNTLDHKFGSLRNDSAAKYNRNEIASQEILFDSKEESKHKPKRASAVYGSVSVKHLKVSENSPKHHEEELEYVDGIENLPEQCSYVP